MTRRSFIRVLSAAVAGVPLAVKAAAGMFSRTPSAARVGSHAHHMICDDVVTHPETVSMKDWDTRKTIKVFNLPADIEREDAERIFKEITWFTS